MASFAKTLLGYYDKKMLKGEVTFFTSGIEKGDFTKLCMDGDYIIPIERTKAICEKLNLNNEEIATLMSFYNEED